MPDIQQLTKRIYALAERTNASPTTLSRKLFGGGNRLAELAEGTGSMTLAVYERVTAELAAMEREARKAA